MAFGKKRPRSRKKSKGGLFAAARRNKKRREKLEAEEEAREGFRSKWPKIAKKLDEIRTDAAIFQEPRFEYSLSDQMLDVFELWSGLSPKERKLVLRDLNEVYETKSDATSYLAVMKAASIPGYNPKQCSKNAGVLQAAIKKNVSIADFEEFRKASGKGKDAQDD